MSRVKIGYYIPDTSALKPGYHLSRIGLAKDRPLCGAASRDILRQNMGWHWTRQPLTVERARVRMAKQKRRFCRTCDRLAEKLRDPISRLGELV